MDLTDGIKKQIDEMGYEGMLRRWRFAPSGDEMFQGESGEYYKTAMCKRRDKDPTAHTRASRAIGW